ncbi:hypothetical protein SOVF_018460 [Spinacia oleracea]|nr:hypothetical protein SOVF_018460 [Spinacia oleracea]
MKRMALKMKRKFDKYWGDLNLLIFVAAAMDPRNKLKLIEFSFRSLYDDFEASEHIYYVKETLYDIYKEYVDTFSHENVIRGEQVDGVVNSENTGASRSDVGAN